MRRGIIKSTDGLGVEEQKTGSTRNDHPGYLGLAYHPWTARHRRSGQPFGENLLRARATRDAAMSTMECEDVCALWR